MGEPINEEELSALFMQTGQHHHQAYESADGVDPDWPLFYAGYLQGHLWDRLGRVPTRSELIHLLVSADKAFQATGKEWKEWPGFYAKFFIENFDAS